MSGGIFKRCGCRSAETGRLLSSACPQLPERGHGSWYFDCAVPVLPGRRERLRRGGYPTRREAIAARDALLGGGDTATAEGWTVQRWLRYWLTTRTKIRPTTLRSYEVHVERHLIPHLDASMGLRPIPSAPPRLPADPISAVRRRRQA